MMKTMKKLRVTLLSLVTVFALTVPALAVPASDYAVLNVRYAPNGTPVNSTAENPVEYRVYKIADAERSEAGGYEYTLTWDFADCGVDVNEILKGGQVSEGTDPAAQRNLLAGLGAYVNETAPEPYAKAETGQAAVSADNTPVDGIARFTKLEDGLYLVTCSAAARFGRTTYTPVPFLVNIPYEFNGVTNNYLTATVKFTSVTSSSPSNPTPTPSDPVTPEEPEGPGEPGEPEDPELPPEIDLLPDDVPLAGLPEEPDPDIEIPEEEIPLAGLPQTGLLWWPVPVLAAAGVVVLLVGVKKRADRDE